MIEAVSGSTTLTLGPGFTLHGGFGDIGGSRFFGNSFALVNNGAITADLAGQSLDIPSRVTLTNNGSLQTDAGATLNLNAVATSGSGAVSVQGGTLNVGGTVATVVFTNFTRSGGTVNLTGTLTNTGNTFTFNATTGTWNLLGGAVVGGTIAFTDGQTLAVSANTNNRLNGVAITGDLLLNQANSVVRILNGLSITGTVRVSGDGASLAFEGTQTWSTGTVLFEGTTGSRRLIEAVGGSTTLTLGPGFTLHGGFGDIGGSRFFGNSFSLVNNGAILADLAGQSLDIPSRVTLTNNGTLQAVNGGSLSISALTANHAGTFRAGVNSLVQVNGVLSQAAAGLFFVDVQGLGITNFGRVTVTGGATLDGTLSVNFVNSYVPNVGDSFQVVTYASRTGAFSAVNPIGLGAGLALNPTYNATNLTLTTAAALMAAGGAP